MANIIDPQLSIEIDRTAKTGSLRVSCGLEFTDSEVRAMNVFGRQYVLECHLLGRDGSHADDSAIAFGAQRFPRSRDDADQYAEPVFTAMATTSDLEGNVSATDALAAELALSNEDLGVVAVKRTPEVAVNRGA
jgi:hypothetical protein